MIVSTAERIATFGIVQSERMSEIDRVLHDVDLVFQGGEEVDGGIGDEQRLRIGRYVHDEDVADPTCRANSRFLADDLGHQLVGMQAPFHQRVRFAGAHQLDRLRGCRMAVGLIDHSRSSRFRLSEAASAGCGLRPDQNKLNDLRFGSLHRAPQRHSSQGCATAVRNGAKPWQRYIKASYFLCLRARDMALDLTFQLLRRVGGDTGIDARWRPQT